MSTIERSARVVRQQVMDFLGREFPPALATARAAWGATVSELPDPVAYDPYETQNLDVLPRLSLSMTRTVGFTEVDWSPAAEESYDTRSSCAVFAWVKFLDENPTQQVRDDYATVLTSVLLGQPSLGMPGEFRLEKSTLEVSYSDVTKVKGDRWIAGVAARFDLTHSWNLRRVPIGSADSVTVEATVLPVHPGLE